MKITMKIITLILIGLLWSCSEKKELIPADIAIKNITIVDAQNEPTAGMTVLIKGDRIVAIGNELSIDDGVKIIDGTDKFLMPGLWDFHVHLTFDSLITPSMYNLFIANGITSIRDTGGLLKKMLPMKARAESDPTKYPRLMWAGPLLDGQTVVYDGSNPYNPEIGVGIKSTDDARNMITELEQSGVNLLKAYEMLSPEVYQSILAIANEKNLPVTGHVPLSMDVITASNAGLSSMEHFRNIEMSAAANAPKLLEDRLRLLAAGQSTAGSRLRSSIHSAQRIDAVRNIDSTRLEAIAEALARNNTAQVPTLGISGGPMHALWEQPEWLDTFDGLSKEAKALWLDNAASLRASSASEEDIEYAKFCYSLVRYLADRGVKIMAGTDTPIYLLTPGFSLHKELEFLVNAGLSEREALAAATTLPAGYFNLEGELGLVKEDYLADLVILDANPLQNISNTQKINGVFRNGKYYDRKGLDKLLNR